MLFKIVGSIFVLVEALGIYQLWFLYSSREMLLPGNFKTYQWNRKNEIGDVIRLYSIWVANCKSIFVLILVPVIISNDQYLHLYTCHALIAGCSIYYINMHNKVQQLVSSKQLDADVPETLSMVIGRIFIPMFVIADLELTYNLFIST